MKMDKMKMHPMDGKPQMSGLSPKGFIKPPMLSEEFFLGFFDSGFEFFLFLGLFLCGFFLLFRFFIDMLFSLIYKHTHYFL